MSVRLVGLGEEVGWQGFGIYTEKQTKIKYAITTSTLNHNNDLSV